MCTKSSAGRMSRNRSVRSSSATIPGMSRVFWKSASAAAVGVEPANAAA
jgi:hypothetical protein